MESISNRARKIYQKTIRRECLNGGMWLISPILFVLGYLHPNISFRKQKQFEEKFQKAIESCLLQMQQIKKSGGEVRSQIIICKPSIVSQAMKKVHQLIQTRSFQKKDQMSGNVDQMISKFCQQMVYPIKQSIYEILPQLKKRMVQIQKQSKQTSFNSYIGILATIVTSSQLQDSQYIVKYIGCNGKTKQWIDEINCRSQQQFYSQKTKTHRIEWKQDWLVKLVL